MVMRLYATFGSAEFQKAYQEVLNLEFEDYADFRKRYPASNAEAAAARMTVYVFFEGVGVLVRRKLISMDLVDDLLSTNILVTWEKVKPIVEGSARANVVRHSRHVPRDTDDLMFDQENRLTLRHF
jgi:hypothetical protein